MIITNPSLKEFEEFIGENSNQYYNLTFKRTHNYIIYSTYEFNYTVNESQEFEYGNEKRTDILDNLKGNYTGFFSNFKKVDSNIYYSMSNVTTTPIAVDKLKDTSDPNSPEYRDR